jgi:O-acetyl-ADP-ribose deacetylase (regulator of RNase III)
MEIVQTRSINKQAELRLLHGDLTRSDADAIVNAANEHLRHGAGVAGAIVRRGGRIIQDESDAWVREHGPVSHSKAAITTAGDLPCGAVIHVVGPRWGEGDEDRKLIQAVTSALEMAQERQFKSVAFPAISTGIFGFPMKRAAEVMLSSIEDFFERDFTAHLERVDLVLFDHASADTFASALQGRWSGST